MNEWKKFAVKSSSDKPSNSCIKFSSLFHTCHFDNAINIVKQKFILPQLVDDKSILRDKLIKVAWLSPNTWAHGYRYGSYQFRFPIQSLLEDKNIYWVEHIKYPNHFACRILITEEEHNFLEEYNIYDGQGPWWYNKNNNTHYFNNNHALEILFEGSIPLKACNRLSFVKHHHYYCSLHSKNPKNCKEINNHVFKNGALFLSKCLADDIHLDYMKCCFLKSNPEFITDDIKDAFSYFIKTINKNNNFHTDADLFFENKQIILKSMLLFFTQDKYEECKFLSSFFNDIDDFIHVAKIVFCKCLCLQGYEEEVTKEINLNSI